jgi:CRISPR/Cas system-associated endonuclease Cas1
MEEFRPYIADRLTLSLINLGQVQALLMARYLRGDIDKFVKNGINVIIYQRVVI